MSKKGGSVGGPKAGVTGSTEKDATALFHQIKFPVTNAGYVDRKTKQRRRRKRTNKRRKQTNKLRKTKRKKGGSGGGGPPDPRSPHGARHPESRANLLNALPEDVLAQITGSLSDRDARALTTVSRENRAFMSNETMQMHPRILYVQDRLKAIARNPDKAIREIVHKQTEILFSEYFDLYKCRAKLRPHPGINDMIYSDVGDQFCTTYVIIGKTRDVKPQIRPGFGSRLRKLYDKTPKNLIPDDTFKYRPCYILHLHPIHKSIVDYEVRPDPREAFRQFLYEPFTAKEFHWTYLVEGHDKMFKYSDEDFEKLKNGRESPGIVKCTMGDEMFKLMTERFAFQEDVDHAGGVAHYSIMSNAKMVFNGIDNGDWILGRLIGDAKIMVHLNMMQTSGAHLTSDVGLVEYNFEPETEASGSGGVPAILEIDTSRSNWYNKLERSVLLREYELRCEQKQVETEIISREQLRAGLTTEQYFKLKRLAVEHGMIQMFVSNLMAMGGSEYVRRLIMRNGTQELPFMHLAVTNTPCLLRIDVNEDDITKLRDGKNLLIDKIISLELDQHQQLPPLVHTGYSLSSYSVPLIKALLKFPELCSSLTEIEDKSTERDDTSRRRKKNKRRKS